VIYSYALCSFCGVRLLLPGTRRDQQELARRLLKDTSAA
jgi:hypothetical protein